MTKITKGELYICKGPSKEEFALGGNPIGHWELIGSTMKKVILICTDSEGFMCKGAELFKFSVYQTPDGKDLFLEGKKVKNFEMPASWVRNIEKKSEEEGWLLCVADGESIILQSKPVESKTKN